MQRRISEAKKEKARQMYQEGKRVYQIAEIMNLPYPTVWSLTEGRRRGFRSRKEYLKHLAEQNGFSSLSDYSDHLLRIRGFRNYGEYAEYLVKKMGFKNYTKYQKYLAKQRQKRQPNKELGALIKSRLEELGRTQDWLAEKIGVSHQTVSLYTQGKNVPRRENLGRLFSVLGVDRRTRKSLERLLEG